MNTIQTEPVEYHGRVILETTASCICPYDDRIDDYDIRIDYLPLSEIIELKSLSNHLDSFTEKELSQEEFTEYVFNDILCVLTPDEITVEITENHYGIRTTTYRQL